MFVDRRQRIISDPPLATYYLRGRSLSTFMVRYTQTMVSFSFKQGYLP
jgi:hypothetical protein